MKVLIALLASTCICCAASVGVSEDQLRGSSQRIPQAGEHVTKEAPATEAGGETLVGHLVYDDGSDDGVDVTMPLAAYPDADTCQSVATKPENVSEAAKHHLTLFCKHFD